MFQKFVVVLVLVFIGSSKNIFAQEELLDGMKSWCGTWIMKTSKQTIIEEWDFVNPSLMQGTSSVVTPDGDTIPTETIRLEVLRGIVFYTPTVKAQNDNQPVPFKLINESEEFWRFENAGHDFPQVIEYRKINDETLKATISGKDSSGKEKKMEFNYTKAN
jgi:hypothetical protein